MIAWIQGTISVSGSCRAGEQQQWLSDRRLRLILPVQLLMNIVSALSTSVKKRHPIVLTVALAGPWILWAAVLTGAIVVRLA